MSTLDELKKKWNEDQINISKSQPLDKASLEKILKSRIKKYTDLAMQYFWASFALQIIVYALLGHVLIRFWYDTEIRYYSIIGVLLFLPFTFMLMNRFKRMAFTKPANGTPSGTSLYHHVLQRHALLSSFFRFKKRYELILVPLSSAIGILIIFKMYLPGNIEDHLLGAFITFALTIISCAWAIIRENKRNFEKPLHEYELILDELKKG